MRAKTNLFLIDGQPMLAPDADMNIAMEDLDAADSGRDESGAMHRFVVRHGLGQWSFSYAHLTQEEYEYMERLFAGKVTFQFSYPSQGNKNQTAVTTAYRRQHGIRWHSLATGQFRNYGFSIIQC